MPFYTWSCDSAECRDLPVVETVEHRPVPVAPKCERCGAPLTQDLMASAKESLPHIPASQFPYVTKNFNGKPIEVTSPSHLKALCNSFGVTHRPDVAWTTKRYEGYDWRRGTQKYSEGSGLGLPGCWAAAPPKEYMDEVKKMLERIESERSAELAPSEVPNG